jgi:hypothetical protein
VCDDRWFGASTVLLILLTLCVTVNRIDQAGRERCAVLVGLTNTAGFTEYGGKYGVDK